MAFYTSTRSRFPGAFPLGLILVFGVSLFGQTQWKKSKPTASWVFEKGSLARVTGEGRYALLMDEVEWEDQGGWWAPTFGPVSGGVVAAGEGIDLEGSYSFAVWVRSSRQAGQGFLLGRPHSNAGWATPLPGLMLSGGKIVFGGWGEPERAMVTGGKIVSGVWTFLAGTWDGSTLRIYQDGKYVGEKPAKGNPARPGLPLVVGAGPNAPGLPFLGAMGSAHIWERCLSADEIAALHGESSARYLRAAAVKRVDYGDETITVASPGSSPKGTWLERNTRVLSGLAGFRAGEEVKVDGWGGRLDKAPVAATGFFRTALLDGRWWFITPSGTRLFNIGFNHVYPAQRNKTDPAWPRMVTDRLRDLGCNSTGNGSSIPALLSAENALPVTPNLNVMARFAKSMNLTHATSGHTGFSNQCFPVFHPGFEAFARKTAADDLKDLKTNSRVLGIFSDNELECPVDLLDRNLSLDPEHPDLKYGRSGAEAFIAARGKTRGNLSRRDRYEFIAEVFSRYHRITQAAIRRVDTNHLYIGSRYDRGQGQFDNPWFWKACGPYVDVMSANYYVSWGPDREMVSQWTAWSGKPAMLTEWYSKAMDAKGLANVGGAGFVVKTQADRAAYYQHFMLNALEIPSLIGVHHYKYGDDSANTRDLAALGGANKGLYDEEENPWSPLVEKARDVHHACYRLIDFFDAREGRK